MKLYHWYSMNIIHIQVILLYTQKHMCIYKNIYIYIRIYIYIHTNLYHQISKSAVPTTLLPQMESSPVAPWGWSSLRFPITFARSLKTFEFEYEHTFPEIRPINYSQQKKSEKNHENQRYPPGPTQLAYASCSMGFPRPGRIALPCGKTSTHHRHR